jgi:hypothetical protein
MNSNQRPLSVTILAWLYIAVGTVGFFGHLTGLNRRNVFQFDGVWIELTELTAILCGAFMLRGHNWARWLAMAWIGLHVVLSVLDSHHGLDVHSVLFLVIAWLLFRPQAGRYFRGLAAEAT